MVGRPARRLWWTCPILLIALLLAPLRAAGQPAENGAEPSSLFAQIEAERKALPETADAETVSTYKRAADEAKLAADFAAKAKAAAAETASTEGRLKAARDEHARLAAEPNVSDADSEEADHAESMTLQEIEAKLNSAQTLLEENQSKSTALSAEPQRRADWRRVDYPREIERVRKALDELNNSTPKERPADAPPAPDGLEAAKRALGRASAARYESEASWLEGLRKQYEAQVELVTQSRELAARRVLEAERIVKRWRDIANARRRREAQEQADTAQYQKIVAHPLLKELAEDNEKLADERKRIAAALAGATEVLEQEKSELGTLKAARKSVEEKVASQEKAGRWGMTDSLGLLLRRRLAQLPDASEYRRRIRERQTITSEAQFEQIDRNAELLAVSDIEAQASQIVKKLPRFAAPEERASLEAAALDVLETRRTILRSLVNEYELYLGEITSADLVDVQMLTDIVLFEDYLREHVLWVRSRPLSIDDFRRAPAAAAWMADRAQWTEVGSVLAADAHRNAFIYAPVVLLTGILIAFGRRIRRRITQLGSEAAGYVATMRPTLESTIWTVLIAAPPAMITGFLWWRLIAAADASPRVAPIAIGLRVATIVLCMTEILRHVMRKQGLAEAHFGWPRSLLSRARNNLRWLLLLITPIAFCVAAIEAQENEFHKLSLGRLGYIAGMGVVALFALRVLRMRDRDPITEASIKFSRKTLRALAAPVSVSTAALLAVIAALGWYYAAIQVTWRLQATLWLLLGLSIFYSLLTRWLLVARRRVAIRQARERREATLVQAKEGEAATGSETSPPAESVNPNANLITINVQTTRLLRASLCFALLLGSWLIWSNLMPALRVFDEWTGPVKTGQLVLAGAVLVMTVIAAKNVPGLLEIAVLERLPLDHGARYAISSLTTYLAAVLGIVIAARTVGLHWENVQWLIAAITVGLGFGLQEIFANFVSGVIILFERPMRVGDIVTIDDMTGSVTRIRIRATTLMNADHRELIVPNKMFITGKLLNWTLSDSTLRLVARVGVAYGADTGLAREMLLQAAREHPHVLSEPAPMVIFMQFGASSLDFELRVYYSGIEKGDRLRHELNMAIDQKFREARIEIAFPQQDIHIRSLPDQSVPAMAAPAQGPVA